jgi:hypothetical protein
MTRFADQLFDDLIREHGSALANVRPPAPARRAAVRRSALAVAGGGVAAAAAAAGVLASVGGATPAYAVTTHPDGTVTLSVYQKSGFSGANAKLHELGDSRVYVVPVGPGCPSMGSLPAPGVPGSGRLSVQSSVSASGSVTVNAKGIPAGDILVVGFETTTSGNSRTSLGAAKLTTGPAPSCVSLPAPPPPPASQR